MYTLLSNKYRTLIKSLLKSKYPALGRVLWIPMNASTSTTEEYLF